MTDAWGWVTAFAAVLGSLLFLYPLVSRIQRRNQERRPNGAHPEHTWTCDALEEGPETDRIHKHTSICDTPEWSSRRKIHLLRCLLKESFPEARILSFAYNSDWLIDAPVKTAQQIGERLHDQLVRARNERKQALCEALCASEESKKIVHDTSGILFLGTPHQGSPMSRFGFIIAWVTGFLGSSTGLLFTLRHHSDELTDLRRRFHNVYRSLIVDRDSAEGPATKIIDIDTDHSGLNKCPRPSGELHNAIVDAIKEMRRPSLLERGDKQIRDCYTSDRLKIQRLSGSILPMNQCYINLAIVKAREYGQPSFRTSLLERLNIEEPDENLHMSLSSLFEPHTIRDEEGKGRAQRILIRGRPGVGKTTLCKKIVHDFIHRQQWNDLFTRLLWIPLRNLESYQGGYNLTNLLREEYFPDEESPVINEIYQELQKHDAGGSLFLLDGLDEIRQHLSHGSSLHRLVKTLLKQPNVIVTSRPSVQLSEEEFGCFDLELETIGFYSDQVREYVQQVTKNDETKEWTEKSRKINNFINQHPLIGDLVRIPIQLDALCFAWDDVSSKEPQTMTDLYQAIERGLWKKDAARLSGEFSMKTFHRGEIEQHVGDEILLLEKLAFAGLYKNLTVFDANALSTLSKDLAMRRGKTIDETLRSLSFLRSSDVSSNNASRHYYFLHLTLQEYFAARYLTRKWVEGDSFKLPGSKESLDATIFLCRYKYSEKFDIVWRFMAGLLSSDSECRVRFFQVIQTQAVDLLGPAHQRLLMRCWFEIPVSDDSLRKQFENQLSEWLSFEYDLLQPVSHCSYVGTLAKEMEVPTGVFSKLLRESVVGLKTLLIDHLIDSNSVRCTVSAEIIRIAISCLEGLPNQQLVLAVLQLLYVRLRSLSDGDLQITQQMLEDLDSSAWKGGILAHEELELILRAIISQLKNSDSEIQQAAMYVLVEHSDTPEQMFQGLNNRLEDSTPNARQNVTKAPNRELYYSTSHNFRQAAPKGQSNLNDLEPQALVDRLEDPCFDIQLDAAKALQAQSNLSEPILKTIADKLGNSNSNVRNVAIAVLWRRPNLEEPILQAIVSKLEDSDYYIRKAAIEALGAQSNLEGQILQAVVDRLADSDSYVQRLALRTLEKQSNLPDSVFPGVSSIFKQWPPSELDYWDFQLLSILNKFPKLTLATFDCRDKFKGLFLFLLRQSFERHIVWYHYDNKLHLVIDDEVVQYEGEDPRYIIEEVVPELPGGERSRYRPTEEA
ncbi:hypothetical protein FHL15_011108 [Xylaria flabelliformis]|uniref:NACHT domain-containing protein n=1 Tax=Xylaria flabelliformis TaxID=2512241 RepID=A0A553HJ79_9PEZI|nr:hypothetical protein FHL15_011108 [Xylaria flabelliformis]